MMKRFAFASALGLAAVAAGLGVGPVEPEPQPDPALVERLALASTAAAEAPTLDKADRIVKAVDRSEPDRLAGAAQALLAR
jgi:hypothetical protein